MPLSTPRDHVVEDHDQTAQIPCYARVGIRIPRFLPPGIVVNPGGLASWFVCQRGGFIGAGRVEKRYKKYMSYIIKIKWTIQKKKEIKRESPLNWRILTTGFWVEE